MNCAAIIMRTELSRAADAAMRREENGTQKNRIIYGNYNYTARTGTENNNMAKISGLGRGLENIFSDNAVEERNDITKLKITQIEPRSDQPRKDFDPESLAQLADSIAAHGVLQPLLVRESGDGFYEIIAGERRFRASKLAGRKSVPAIVREVDDKSALAMALIENMQREDLNAVEEAMGVSRLIEEFGFTHEQAADAIGRSRSATSNLLRLLNLTEVVKQMLADGKIDMGHARALLALSGAEQIQAANEIVAKDLSVRETERLVARLAGQDKQGKEEKPAKKEKSADDRILEERLADSIGAPVHLVYGKKGRGRIVIDFADLDDLDALIAKLAPEKM